jgi:hypothetical protein
LTRRPIRCCFGERRKRSAQIPHGSFKGGWLGKGRSRFGPDHGGCNQRTLGGAPVESSCGSRPILLVRAKDIEQDIGIDRGDHRFPRISEMNASVSKFLPRQPQTRCVGLGSFAFTAISRPRSSVNSSTVPGLTPSRSRNGFGITTCPRSATRLFSGFVLRIHEIILYDFGPWQRRRRSRRTPSPLCGSAEETRPLSRWTCSTETVRTW